MKRWEYKQVSGGEDTQEKLDELGALGWELVSTTQVIYDITMPHEGIHGSNNGGDVSSSLYLFFKRELTDAG